MVEGKKMQKVNFEIPEQLYEKAQDFGKKYSLYFSDVVRISEEIFGEIVVDNKQFKKYEDEKGIVIKQVKFKEEQYKKIKSIVKENKINVGMYLCPCLEKVITLKFGREVDVCENIK